VGFGSNLGDGPAILNEVVQRLGTDGYAILQTSPLYHSVPWGGAEGNNFTNAVLEVERQGSAQEFLGHLLSIEAGMGRTRERPGMARICDLDLLFWGGDQIALPDLRVPHPRLHLRKFVLIPLCDVIPDAEHPQLRRKLSALLADCPDPLHVWPY
jgi:2-amino-4-hydroxy-6-hydroxymethyldihydropteridine diphosphokinase